MLRMKESKFGAPVGIYVGEFLGIQPFKQDGPPRLGKDGKPMGPAVEWQFKITEGECAGQIVGRLTSDTPTTKNACGVLLSGLVGRVVGPEEEIDENQYRGQLYQLVIGPNKDNPEKTYVTQIVRHKNGAPAPLSAAPAGGPGPKPPPRRQPAPAQPAAMATVPEDYFWVETDPNQDAVRMSRHQVCEYLTTTPGAKADTLAVMADDGSNAWKTAKELGLDVLF